MELFGIMFSLPVAFVTSAIYCALVNRFIKPDRAHSRVMLWGSVLILILLLAEIFLLFVVGPFGLKASLGEVFYPAHLVLFLLSVPSLANILQLQRAVPFIARWYFIAPLCTVLALGVVLLQYLVTEALFGIDGPW